MKTCVPFFGKVIHWLGLVNLLLIGIPITLRSQGNDSQRLNRPGDMFNLAACMNILMTSPTLEEFEKRINTDSVHINQLDLNLDARVDYIRVFDKQVGSDHAIVLQALLGVDDVQDIAVFSIRKENGKVLVEAIGDEDMYGPGYVIRPSKAGAQMETPNPAYEGQSSTETYRYDETTESYSSHPSYCPEPEEWVIVHFVFAVGYNPWYSPWYWGAYPSWWFAWSPWYWDTYYTHWYYYNPWPGWWYWHTAYPHSPHWYGPYRAIRRTSSSVGRFYDTGRYNAVYNNPRPVVRPKLHPRFPAHTLEVRKNPAVIRMEPVNRGGVPGVVSPSKEGKRKGIQSPKADPPRHVPAEPQKKDRWWKRPGQPQRDDVKPQAPVKNPQRQQPVIKQREKDIDVVPERIPRDN